MESFHRHRRRISKFYFLSFAAAFNHSTPDAGRVGPAFNRHHREKLPISDRSLHRREDAERDDTERVRVELDDRRQTCQRIPATQSEQQHARAAVARRPLDAVLNLI